MDPLLVADDPRVEGVVAVVVARADDSGASASSCAEGSPLDRNFYTVLMIMGLVVLLRRRVSLVEVLRETHGSRCSFSTVG